jgi:DNA-binding NarL/FixJ family response regulator
LFLLGLRTSIENRHPDLSVVGEAQSGAELFALLKTVVADIVLLDIILPDISGIEIARRLKTEYPKLKILVLSADNSASTIKEMIDIGIDGFIGKRESGIDLFTEAIHSIMQGVSYFGKDISEIICNLYLSIKKTSEVSIEFTKQEKSIIELSFSGLPAKLIADRLKISINTVNWHKANIFRKLGINSAAEMVQYALKTGIIKL